MNGPVSIMKHTHYITETNSRESGVLSPVDVLGLLIKNKITV